MDIDSGNMKHFIDEAFHVFSRKDLSKKNISFLKQVHLNTNESLYLLDLFQNKIIYKKGFPNLLGYDDDKITVDFLFKNLHPDDSEIVHRVTKVAILYAIDHPNSSNTQLFLTYRHKTKDNSYIKILNQVTIFDKDKNGNLKTLLIRLTDISFLDNSENVSFTFNAEYLDEKLFRDQIYEVYKTFFTQRELNIIHEVNKRSTNKQIAKKLKISDLTVATHRKNILRKAKCHNPEELILFCKGKGIL